MAEFKLGRIRFIWKSDWVTGTAYLRDDIIRYGGKTFICVVGHTASADFYTDLNDATPKWQEMNAGTDWKGDWTTDTVYKVNDIVKYGGYLYIANTGHTSASTATLGLEDDQASWDLFAEGFDYKGLWATSTRYKINDIVKYGGRIYLANAPHTSAATVALGLENDQASWTLFSEGINWNSTWTPNTRYVYGDVVSYGGILYLCNTGHTSAASDTFGLEVDQGKWDVFHSGFEYKGNWASSTRYKVNDLVRDGGTLYICISHHTSSDTPSIEQDQSFWAVFVPGLEFEDSWDVGTYYQIGDLVTYGGYTYVAKTNNNGLIPPQNTDDWDVFLTGFNFRGEYGDDSSNQDYRPGDVVRVGGWTYLCTAESNGNRPPDSNYWEKLNEGIEWNNAWTNSTYYDLGDAVYYNNNSYICILSHTSDNSDPGAANRPNQANGVTYWNLIASGSEQAVLTTRGDLLFYGASGPERLPIGQSGQILQVNAAGTEPEWVFYGQTEFVYYVDTNNGVDDPAPAYGVTEDRPWKTIRYGLEQIERGSEYYNAKNLLELNRSFIQAEVVEWIDYQVTNTIAPFTGGFSYDKEICRRDMGLIVDAIAYDLSHGGNKRTREAALAYYPGDSSGIYIPGEEEETVAALDYAVEVITAVLNNVAPAANYQTLNAVGSPITQQINSNFTAESTAIAASTSLMTIIQDAIENGNTDNIPALVFANKTLKVKTGNFFEVLPMIVPRYTAVVGEELRSTRVTAANAYVASADVPETLDGIDRLKNIVSDIVQNIAVTPTTGNAESQITSRPAGSAGNPGSITAVTSYANEIIDILTNTGSAADALVFTDSGVALKTTARTELQANRASIISDLTTWIGSNYPSLVYDSAKCERDVGYIVDALSYDIQYGTNSATLINAQAYFVGAVSVLPAGEVAPTAAALDQLSTIVQGYLSGAAEQTEADGLLQIIEDVVTAGNLDSLPAESLPDITWASSALQSSHAALIAAKSTIQSDGVQYVKVNYDFTFNETTCSRDVGYIVDALAYDMVFGSNYRSVTAGLAYYRATESAQVVINDQLDAQIGITQFIRDKARYIVAGGAGAAVETLVDDIYKYIDSEINSNGETPIVNGTNTPLSSTGYTYAVECLEANRDFIIAEITAYIADTYPLHSYDVESCERDVSRYIDALKYDLIYQGNYSSILAARYYKNAVLSSTQEDMFYAQNGTGLRNLTVLGLNGSLGAANSYGTKRPSAGAYVSLDPGWGPNDESVWILTRSPYVQNVTTFGNGCVGLKVDGDLHNGGNDSIVANDFTQLLSDGIGAWVTNLGRAELVSVFSYYGHISYLAENGGKIRATNGNSSYGTFGTVAEGTDETEVPITGSVDNRTREAQIGYVMTDGDDILWFEYTHAGEGYTTSQSAIKTISNVSAADGSRTQGTYRGLSGTSDGSGTGQEFDVIINASGFAETITIVKGGSGHVTSDTITIADSDLGDGGAADLTFDVDTVGNATVYTITGEGFGASIDQPQTRDGGVFQIRLLDPDDSSLDSFGGAGYVTTNSQAQEGNTTQIRLAATDSAGSATYIGMAIWLIGGLGAGQYGYIDTYNAGTKLATVRKVSDGTAGWDTLFGGSVEALLDGTTEYVIEPRVTFPEPESSGVRALARAIVTDDQISSFRIIEPGTGYDPNDPPAILITDTNETAPVPYETRVGNGVLAQPTWIDRGTDFETASATVTGDGYADFYQNGQFIYVRGLTQVPQEGSNVEFADIPSTWYKLVQIRELTGNGPYAAQLQISPAIDVSSEPLHLDDVTIRLRYSQVRLTGHDFLEIGTGNFTTTNYPNEPLQDPNPDAEVTEGGGGRVFYTSTDQDGNFRVGGLFNVEQSTGIASLNVESFNISGLNELQIGEIELGGTGAVITEFSTDGTFTANSDNIVPTQKAIKTYITSQIGSGAATLNVNSLTAGQIRMSTNTIELTTGNIININTNVNFTGTIDGGPAAFGFFLGS